MKISGRVSLCRTFTRISPSMITSNIQMSSVPSRWAWWPPPAPSPPAINCWSLSPPRWTPGGAAGRPCGVNLARWHEGAQLLHHLLWEDGQIGWGVFFCCLTRSYGCWRWILYVILLSLVLNPSLFFLLPSIVWPEQTQCQIRPTMLCQLQDAKPIATDDIFPKYDFRIVFQTKVELANLCYLNHPGSCTVILER